MSGSALKRVRKAVGLPVSREALPAFAWPGGYPIYYLFADGGVCCPRCANRNIVEIDQGRTNSHGGWALSGHDVHYEDDGDGPMNCDHCGERIVPAYGND